MLSLWLAAAFFVGIHLFVSGTGLRATVVARLGEPLFRGLFALGSLVGIVWLSRAWSEAPRVLLWRVPGWTEPVVLVLMAIAFLLVAVGMTTPSPTSVGGESGLVGSDPARGILRVTRHPFLCGVALWALVHMTVNGDSASLVLFGALLVLAVAGPRSIDAKRKAALGPRWEPFAAATSVVPFAAIVQGRNRFVPSEIGWWRVGLSAVLYSAMLYVHRWLFGVPPLVGG